MSDIICKSIITKSKLPKTDYCCNVYVGCTHACVYCYARFMRRFTGHPNDAWGSFVDNKSNAAAILKKEIMKVPTDKWVLLGSVTDSYQPIERSLCLTRDCLNIMSDFDINVSILTKSSLVLRDIDILKKLTNCEVGISCGINNDSAARVLEPNSNSIDERLNALRILKQNGIKCYAFIGPIIPYITDLEGLFNNLKGNVDFIMAESLNLRGADISLLRNCLIKLVGMQESDKILNTCQNDDYWEHIQYMIEKLCIKYGIENRGFFNHSKRKV